MRNRRLSCAHRWVWTRTSFRQLCDDASALGFDVRVGVHTGEVELDGLAVRGLAVHIGARIAAEAAPGDVLVTSTVKDLVAGSGLVFSGRGRWGLKGVPGEWETYSASAPGNAIAI